MPVAYDYAKQEWQTGAKAGPLLLKQLREELAALDAPNGREYARMLGVRTHEAYRARVAHQIADLEVRT